MSITDTAGSLVGIDWGTSSLRGALMNRAGEVLESRAFARGILSVPAGQFPTVFKDCFGDWMQAGVLCLMSGMVGSQQGWQQAAYCPCPAGFADLAGQLHWLEPGRMAIVPGLRIEQAGVPDVMRGEETQIFGALAMLGLQDAKLVLPGTHSKWVQVKDGRVVAFSSWMTGEFYALLRQHSILARSLPADDAAPDPEAFDEGVAQALRSPGLLHSAFSVRTLSLFERMTASALPSYLSGLVIGEEIKSQTLATGENLVIMGSENLSALYQQALAQRGVTARRVGAEANWHGLHALAQSLRN
jgi:2-dehydro-3-deoxygalactonokinase